jgi:CMP-N-acetylneuraminic acid synthetase
MIALIPARIGSNGVPLKNLRDLGGYPLLAWSVAAARILGYNAFVSSDSEDILEVSKKYEAIPHLRKSGGDDISTDIDVVKDLLLKEKASEIIYLRPTTPFRNPVRLKRAVELWESVAGFDCLCSGDFLSESADKLMKKGKDMGKLIPYNDNIDIANIHNPRQSATETFQTNGVIDIFKTNKVSEGVLWGIEWFGFVTPNIIEIDTEEDLEYANWWINRNGHPLLDYMRAIYGKT